MSKQLTKILFLTAAIFILTFVRSPFFDFRPGSASAASNTTLDFDGSNDYVVVSDNAVLDQANSLSLSVWIEPDDAPTGDEYILYRYNNYYLKINSSRQIVGSVNTDSARVTSAKTITADGAAWTHIELTYDKDAGGTDEIKLYINGVLDAVGDYSTAITASDKKLYIGAGDIAGDNTPENWFDGQIDNPKLYAYARAASEILLDYNNGLATHLGPSGKTCSEDPAGCMDYGLAGYWNMDEGGGQMAKDLSGNGNHGALGATATAGADDPLWTKGKNSGGLKFDGIDDYVVTSSFSLSSIDNTLTFSGWFNVSSVAGVKTIFGDASQSASVGFFWIYKTGDYLYYQYADGSINRELYSTGYFTGYTDTWVHIAIVADYDNQWASFYRNGVLVNTMSTPSVPMVYPTTDRVKYIGAYRADTGYYIGGLIDEVRIYNRALSAEEVRYHYNRGGPVAEWKFDEGNGTKAYDSTENNNNGTLTNFSSTDTGTATSGSNNTLTQTGKTWTINQWINGTINITGGTGSGQSRTISSNTADTITVSSNWTTNPDATSTYSLAQAPAFTSGKYGSAIQFDGKDDYVNAGNGASLNITNEITIEAWVNVLDATIANQMIISKSSASASTIQYRLSVSSGLLALQITNGTTQFSAIKAITNGVHHTVGILNNNVLSVYLDTVKGTDGTLTGTQSTTTSNVLIGAQRSSSPISFFSGYIDEVRIYNYARTIDQIQMDYNAGVAAHLK